MMHLALLGMPIGMHLAGWRHPEAFDNSATSFESGVEVARLAEAGKFDLLFFADSNGVTNTSDRFLFESNNPIARPGWFEPTTYLAALATQTSHIGLVATATTTFEQPYTLARKFASLDRLSSGRAGWNVVTSANPADALNFNLDEHVDRVERYDRAEEFVDVVFGLWRSWSDEAFILDKTSGRFLDYDKLTPLNHVGKHFKVKGPLNVANSPQVRPLIFNAGGSEAGKELGARVADCIFATGRTKPLAQAAYADFKGRLSRYGRSVESQKIFPGAAVYVGRTSSEAEELYDELNDLISDELGIRYLSQHLGVDMAPYPIDSPFPDLDLDPNSVGMNTPRFSTINMAKSENLTIRQVIRRFVPAYAHPIFKGTGTQVAEEMADWYRSEACDGFLLAPPVQPRSLKDFIELVVPELQRMGIFRKEYDGTTLREIMGLQINN